LLYKAANPVSQLVWYDRSGKPLGLVGDPANFGQFHISPDGRRVVAVRSNPGGSDIWMMDGDRGVATRFTSLPGLSIDPVWSRDGKTVVFASGAPFNLFRKDASGIGPEQRLIESASLQFPNDSSPDGRWILYGQVLGPRNSLWVLPSSPGDGKPRPYSPDGVNDDLGRFSPDGRWVAFQSDESGRMEVYIDAFPEPRGRIRISADGGMFPEWASDGRELFYIARSSTLVSVTLKFGPGGVTPSAPRTLLPVTTPDFGVNPYACAPDGRRFLVSEPEKTAPPLKLIVNWTALLNRAAKSP